MDLVISRLVSSCDSNEQGEIVRRAIVGALKSADKVLLDFTSVTNVTSSFVNSALIELMPTYDVAAIKARIQLKRANRQIGTMINDRFVSEESRISYSGV
jgi:STAS-like domain of unknown function (DUF4325)